MAFSPFTPFNFVHDNSHPPPPSSQLPELVWDNKSTLTKHRDTYSFIDPYRFKNQLRGKIVVITLAHRGIGRATALTFAQAGASVCCVGPIAKSLESLIREIKEKYNTPTLALTADLLEPSAPSYIVQLTEKRFGPIDILINVAPTPYLRPFTQEPDLNAEWWPNLEHTLKSPLALIHAVLPTMIARQSGTIISTTSGSGGITFPFLSMQGVANAALIKFHHQLDLEVQSKGIFSYAVNPGPIPSYLYNPDYSMSITPFDFTTEPEIHARFLNKASEMEWASVGLAGGTFVALCAEPRARLLSGLYINAERDLGELLEEYERDSGRVKRDRLYVLKVDEI